MKSYISRIVSALMAIFFLAVLCVPAFASDSGSLSSPLSGDFWTWVQYSNNWFKSIFDEDICPQSPNTNGRHELVKTHTTVDGKTGYFYVCKHCGKSAGEVGEEAYQQQVSDLPAPGYNSDGSLLIFSEISSHGYYSGATSSFYNCNQHETAESHGWHFDIKYLCDSDIVSLSLSSGQSYFGIYSFAALYKLEAPYDGFYEQYPSLIASYSYTTVDGETESFSECFEVSSRTYFTAGSSVFSGIRSFVLGSDPLNKRLFSAQAHIYPLVFKYTPAPSVDLNFDTIYNINTRPTTITGGNYGIIGDGNQITTITDNRQIINEGDNIYYNPATGQTYTITDWTYNYDGRIYNITLDTGDKVSVEYGDENITITENTINEGDTIVNNYTIYYIIDGSGSGDNPSPAPTACPHEWLKTGERQATCLVPAQRTYTCSICGEQKTETDSVLGHSWHAIQTVTTQYDENGNMTQEGYTIYECERCGEQYKSTNDIGPPPSGGGGSGGGSGDNIFSGIFGLIWDFFTFLFDLFSEFVVGGIKGFISGLKDAGSSFFSILNPFNWDYGG